MTIVECYKKVSKDCLKFIKSQETSKDKFKNKEKMIKSFLIPVSFWIASKANKSKPYFVGLAGGQGTGKTTISSIVAIILRKYFKKNVFKISIDDFYKTRKSRKKLSISKHQLLKIRGVPGTHDYKMISNFFTKLKNKNFKKFKTPKFDKSLDDRCKKKDWYNIEERPDIVILEGWCVGAKAQNHSNISKPINIVEKIKDPNLIWRKYVNTQLKTNYKKLFKELNVIIYLKATNFKLLQKWRIKQENKLWLRSINKKNLKIMSRDEIIKFMYTYQRITQNMFKETPKYASIIMKLNSNHEIKSIKYRSK